MRRKETGPGASADATAARPARFGDTQASVLLDLVRGVAALVVVADHWRNLFFVDYRQLPAHQHLWALPYLLCAPGHQAVVIFFVLSGYLIGGSIFRALALERWSWISYLTHRLVRLWIVVLPGLLLCAALDTVGLWLHRAPLLYHGLSSNHLTPDVLTTRTLPVFVGNLAFLQSIDVPAFGSDGALWSLANEFWYYLLFPLGLFALRRGAIARRLLCAIGFAAVCWIVHWRLLMAFPLWLLGVILLEFRPPRMSVAGRAAVAAAYTALILYFARFSSLRGSIADLLLGFATAGFFWVLLAATEPADPRSAGVRGIRLLARGSFTLYVLHTPVLVLLASLLVGDTRWNPAPATVAVALLALAVTLFVAYAVAAVTEFRTDRVRAWVEHRLGLAK